MQYLAVRDGDLVHIYDRNGSKVLSVQGAIYDEVKEAFANGFVLTDDQVIRPNAVVNYLEESNPILLETEIQIEKNKERRRMRNTLANVLPWVMVFAVLIIAAAIAFAIIHNAGAGIGQAIHNVIPKPPQPHPSPPINIK